MPHASKDTLGTGMTDRDHFANGAMQVILAKQDFIFKGYRRVDPEKLSEIASQAYAMADAMLAEKRAN